MFGTQFNLLIPHSGCDQRNVSDQYVATRTLAGISLDEVLTIAAAPSTQPCDTMALHPRTPFLRHLYNSGEAAFMSLKPLLASPIILVSWLFAIFFWIVWGALLPVKLLCPCGCLVSFLTWITETAVKLPFNVVENILA